MFENIGFSELSLILIVVLVFFGPKKIPELSRAIGRGMQEFKKAMNEVQSEMIKPVDPVSTPSHNAVAPTMLPSEQRDDHNGVTGKFLE